MLNARGNAKTESSSMSPIALPLSNPDWFPSLPTANKSVAVSLTPTASKAAVLPPKPIAMEDVFESAPVKSSKLLGFLSIGGGTEVRSPQPPRALGAPAPLGSSPPKTSSALPSTRHLSSKNAWSTLAQPLWTRTNPPPLTGPRPIDYTRPRQAPPSSKLWIGMRWAQNEPERKGRSHVPEPLAFKDEANGPRAPLPISSSPPDHVANRKETPGRHLGTASSDFPTVPRDVPEISSSAPLLVRHTPPRLDSPLPMAPDEALFPKRSTSLDIWTTNATRPFEEEAAPLSTLNLFGSTRTISPFPTGVHHYDPGSEENLAVATDQLRFTTSPTDGRNPFGAFCGDEEEDNSLDAIKLLLQSVMPPCDDVAEELQTTPASSSALSPWDSLRNYTEKMPVFSSFSTSSQRHSAPPIWFPSV